MCLRLAGALDEVSGQVGVFDPGTSAAITSLSQPVGPIRGKRSKRYIHHLVAFSYLFLFMMFNMFHP